MFKSAVRGSTACPHSALVPQSCVRCACHLHAAAQLPLPRGGRTPQGVRGEDSWFPETDLSRQRNAPIPNVTASGLFKDIFDQARTILSAIGDPKLFTVHAIVKNKVDRFSAGRQLMKVTLSVAKVLPIRKSGLLNWRPWSRTGLFWLRLILGLGTWVHWNSLCCHSVTSAPFFIC